MTNPSEIIQYIVSTSYFSRIKMPVFISDPLYTVMVRRL